QSTTEARRRAALFRRHGVQRDRGPARCLRAHRVPRVGARSRLPAGHVRGGRDMMDVEQLEEWRAADALVDQWLDQAEPDREAWLAAQDMPDAVRRRVQQLVRAHERTGNALDSAAGVLAGRSLGDWTLESELGRGGMAVVYLARREQGMASQRAAVKVLTLAALGAGGRERFQREAGILARLGHPNITRLIDSGVADDGTCWLAMPLVEGERIDQWCQAR